MKYQDDVDTVPVVTVPGRRVEESLDLGVGERGEVVFAPDPLMCRPILTMSDLGSEIRVEAIMVGRRSITRESHLPIECFADGQLLDVSASSEEPLKIIVVNEGPEPTTVRASLVTGRTTR